MRCCAEHEKHRWRMLCPDDGYKHRAPGRICLTCLKRQIMLHGRWRGVIGGTADLIRDVHELRRTQPNWIHTDEMIYEKDLT